MLFALFLTFVHFALSDSCVANTSRVDQRALLYLSTNTMINIDLSTVYPPLGTYASYLAPPSCLGYFGPIGPYGPLGSLGPLGTNTWNPSYWITGSGMDWSDWAKNMSGEGGVLSTKGPLGESGPLSYHAYYEVCPCINVFAHHLMNGGLFSVLGPLGPLGALGPLGPLGPLGAHGYPSNSNGDYYANKTGQIVRTFDAPYSKEVTRTFELFEFYTDEDYVKSLPNNDVSWVVKGDVTIGSNDTYKFTSAKTQYVTIVLVPMKQLDLFSLTVTTSSSRQTPRRIVAKNNLGYVNWIIVKATPGTTFSATVALELSGHFFVKDYMLYVVGSSEYFPMTDILGNHIQFFQ